jgi:hypothetical protein
LANPAQVTLRDGTGTGEPIIMSVGVLASGVYTAVLPGVEVGKVFLDRSGTGSTEVSLLTG